MTDLLNDNRFIDDRLKKAIDFATSMVGKKPSDADLREYLRGTLDPRKHDWCTAFLNATLRHAGIEGTPSMMASSFLSWGRRITQEEARAGDIVITGEDDEPPRPGAPGHAAIMTGPVHREKVISSPTGELDYPFAPTISGGWSHQVKAIAIPAGTGIAEYRRLLPSHRARIRIINRAVAK